MKNYIQLLALVFMFYGCAEKPKNENTSIPAIEIKADKDKGQTDLASKDLKTAMDDLTKNLNLGTENQENTSSEEDALKQLLQMVGNGTSKKGGDTSLEGIFSTDAILDMLEASGVSREEMEKLISNPDSLRILAQEARENRQMVKQGKFNPKGKISEEQLTSKNTASGVSLEEAILLVQAESGPEATMAKLKKIDSLTGSNIMQQMDLTEAGYTMRDVERKNEIKASIEEAEKIEKGKLLSGQLHSEKEAREFLAELEKTERDIKSGTLKASPRYQRAVKHQKGRVKIYHGSIKRKSKAAKKKFQQLNPDLYFGEEVGQTYIGYMKKAVYLPLGKLSFADKVIKVYHPNLKTKDKEFVLGEPDGIISYEVRDDSGIYSLGLGGDLTVQFLDNALTDVNGPDLYIFEMGQIEPTDLEISKDGKTWIKVGKIDGGVAEVDIGPFVKQRELFYYVRLKDLKTKSGVPGADVDAIAAIGAAMRLNLDSKVLFDTGKSELKSAGKEALKELANSIQILNRGSVIVEGHTDDVGGNDTNQKLSLARAKSVSSELKKLIPSPSFKWKEKGYGESKPIVENDSDINRARNRRVEILILPN